MRGKFLPPDVAELVSSEVMRLAQELGEFAQGEGGLSVDLIIDSTRAATVTQGVASFDRNVRLVLGALDTGQRLPTEVVHLKEGSIGSSYRQRTIVHGFDENGRPYRQEIERRISTRAIVAAAILIVATATGIGIVSGEVPPQLIPEIIQELRPHVEQAPSDTRLEFPDNDDPPTPELPPPTS